MADRMRLVNADIGWEALKMNAISISSRRTQRSAGIPVVSRRGEAFLGYSHGKGAENEKREAFLGSDINSCLVCPVFMTYDPFISADRTKGSIPLHGCMSCVHPSLL